MRFVIRIVDSKKMKQQFKYIHIIINNVYWNQLTFDFCRNFLKIQLWNQKIVRENEDLCHFIGYGILYKWMEIIIYNYITK